MQGRSASGHDQIEELKRPAGVYALVTSCRREKLLLESRHRCLRKKRKERGLGSSGGPELPSGSASLSERLRYGRERAAAPYNPSKHSRICLCRFAVFPISDCSSIHLTAISSSHSSISATPPLTSWPIATRSRSPPSPPGTVRSIPLAQYLC